MAKDAGMQYIVITSKHHDGFCLFPSEYTDYDVEDSTSFSRDILRELAEECRRQGIKICWYHSIMDWHHPDYLPRRGWEKLPDYASLQPYNSGIVDAIEVSLQERNENYAFRFSGFISVPRSGIYRFHLVSDDGSRLAIGDVIVVDNDGLHGAKEAWKRIALGPGLPSITVDFFKEAGEENWRCRIPSRE